MHVVPDALTGDDPRCSDEEYERMMLAGTAAMRFLEEVYANADLTRLHELRRKGACNREHHSVLFPGQGTTPPAVATICAQCPVRQDCLEYAIEYGELHGTWGGLGERARKRLTIARRANGQLKQRTKIRHRGFRAV